MINIDKIACTFSLSQTIECIMFVDPNGDSLDIATNAESRADLLSIVSADNRDRVSIDDNGSVSVNTEGLSAKQLKRDKGLSLINNLVKSEESYLFESSEISVFNYNGGEIPIAVSMDDNGIINASNKGCDASGDNTYLPSGKYDGQLAISASGKFTTNGGRSRKSVVFHELAEMYYRTDYSYDYKGNSSNGGFGAQYRAARLEGNYFGNRNPGAASYTKPIYNQSQNIMIPYILNQLHKR